MKVSDERMLEALIKYGSRRKAAAELGINQATITNRLKRADFRDKYEAAKQEILTDAVDGMKKCLSTAINTLYQAMTDKEAPLTVRVSAADSILRHTKEYITTVDISRRIQYLEEREKRIEELRGEEYEEL